MAKYYQYYVEGQDEEKLIQVLKRNVRRMSSGSVRKLRQVCIIPTKI